MTELIIGATLFGIRQDVIGFLDLLELFFRFRVIPVPIWMIFHRQTAEAFLDFVVARIASNTQELVIVFFGHNAMRRKHKAAAKLRVKGKGNLEGCPHQ